MSEKQFFIGSSRVRTGRSLIAPNHGRPRGPSIGIMNFQWCGIGTLDPYSPIVGETGHPPTVQIYCEEISICASQRDARSTYNDPIIVFFFTRIIYDIYFDNIIRFLLSNWFEYQSQLRKKNM